MTAPAPVGNPYEQAAFEAFDWIGGNAVDSSYGRIWSWNPNRPHSEMRWNLYYGPPGVVLGLLQAYRASGKVAYLDAALLGADAVLARVADEAQPGLYGGLAGQAVALHRVYADTGVERYRAGARRAVERLLDESWGEFHDVVSGRAGIGLTLLDLGRELDMPEAISAAGRAGDELIAAAKDDGETHGSDWEMTPGAGSSMPNFAHGTAGVAYFLARLWEETGRSRYFDAASLGACHLLGLAAVDPYFRIAQDDAQHRDQYAVGWCHGPAGTGRLFFLLWRLTRDEDWLRDWRRLSEWIFRCGLPADRPANLGNRISRCCGDAALCEYLADYSAQTGDPRALPLAGALTDGMLARGRGRADGSKWWEQPGWGALEVLRPGTGLMQGVTGPAVWLLRWSGIQHGRPDRVLRLPDDPFGRTPVIPLTVGNRR